MKLMIGILLIGLSLVLGYMGIKKYDDNVKSMDVVGMEIETTDKDGKQESYLFFGGAVISMVGGVMMIRKK